MKTPAKSQVKKMGRNLARLRDAGGMTQEVIAEKAEMHWRHYQKIEAGEIAPGFHALVRLKRALACTWDELFGSIQ